MISPAGQYKNPNSQRGTFFPKPVSMLAQKVFGSSDLGFGRFIT
jgi:hypothetical protein